MEVEVVTPEEFLGDVIGDLSRRRGKVEGQEPRGNALAVHAIVPLSEMFGYVGDLRSSTQGRAAYTMQFARYEEVPGEHRRGDRRAVEAGGAGTEPQRLGTRVRGRFAIFLGLPGPRRVRGAPRHEELDQT